MRIRKAWDEWNNREVWWIVESQYSVGPATIHNQSLIFVSLERARHYMQRFRPSDLDYAVMLGDH